MATSQAVTDHPAGELERAALLAGELLAVGYIREDSIKRYKALLADLQAGRHLARVRGELVELRASGELREEGNDRYQEMLHCLELCGVTDDQADAGEVDQAGEVDAAPARKPAAKKPAKKAKAKGG